MPVAAVAYNTEGGIHHPQVERGQPVDRGAVVVGGVGNIWGTLLGATMVGFLQKGIEWMNPSNTLAAQTYIIIFIQFRPRGIIALKGRAAEA